MGTSTAKTSVIMLLALGVALMAAPSVTGLPAGDNQFSDQVNRLFTERITSSTPGAAVVVTKAGKPVLKRCYGLADLEHGVPVTAGTAFNLASAAKQFTAFSILLLEQKGRIDLDDDVHKYLPELPAYSQPVTIRHLLNNTSGIWEYYSTMTYYCGYDLQDHFTLKEIMELLQHQEALLFEPGSQWSYCNTTTCCSLRSSSGSPASPSSNGPRATSSTPQARGPSPPARDRIPWSFSTAKMELATGLRSLSGTTSTPPGESS
jgi:CubicO group peptidase (beta-lactamase class C family)